MKISEKFLNEKVFQHTENPQNSQNLQKLNFVHLTKWSSLKSFKGLSWTHASESKSFGNTSSVFTCAA